MKGGDHTAPAVDVHDLRVVRGGRTVLEEVGFCLPAGSVTGLLGPSGCGKTSLMRVLVGVQAHVSGLVRVLGLPAGSRPLRSLVGYVTQAPAVYTDLSVVENLRYFAAVVGAADGRVAEVVGQVSLDERADQLVGTLSGGERARVSLATALLGAPRVLVLDEPTVGLDPLLRRELWGLFADLAASGTTLIVSSHSMDEAGHCHRLLLLREGRLTADDTPQGLLDRTGAPDVESAFVALATAGP